MRSRVLLITVLLLSPVFAGVHLPAQDTAGERGPGEGETLGDRAGPHYWEQILDDYALKWEEGLIVTPAVVDSLVRLKDEIETAGSTDLQVRARLYLTLAQEMLEARSAGDFPAASAAFDPPPALPLFPEDSLPVAKKAGLGITLGAAASSLVLFNVFSYLGNVAYGRYVTTSSPQSAAVYQQTWQFYDLFRFVFLGTAALSFGSSFAFILPPGAAAGYSGRSDEWIMEKKFDLQRGLYRAEKNIDFWKGLTYGTLGTGALTFAAGALSLLFAAVTYDRYENAKYSADAEELRNRVEIFNGIMISTAVLSCTSLAVSAVSAAVPRNPAVLEHNIDRLNVELSVRGSGGEVSGQEGRIIRQRILALEKRRSELEKRIREAADSGEEVRNGVITLLAAGVLSLAGSGISLAAGGSLYDEYQKADLAADAAVIRNRMEAANSIAYLTGYTGTVWLGSALLLALSRPGPEKLKRELSEVEGQLEDLRRLLAR